MVNYQEKEVIRMIKKDGVFKYYHENGKLEKEISYKDGDIVL